MRLLHIGTQLFTMTTLTMRLILTSGDLRTAIKFVPSLTKATS
jgi:hypothetical protein